MSTTLTLRLPRLHSAQRAAVCEARRWNVVACGRRWGKTTLGIDRIIHPALRGRPVAYFSPTYRMLTEVWREADRLLRPVARRVVRDEHRIELVTGGVVEMWSLDNPHVARGRKYARVVIDEAAHVNNLDIAWQEVIRPTLADFGGDAWFLSTPNGFDFFHDLWRRGQDERHPDYAAWQMPTTANPYIAGDEVEGIRRDTPERIFSQEYLAQFVDEATAIFRRAWWDGCNRYDPADERLWRLSAARYLSWDTALKDKEGNAYSARIVGELLADYRLAIRHVYRERLQFPALVRKTAADIERWDYDGKLHDIVIEDASSGISLIQSLDNSLPAERAAQVHRYPPQGDKATRAELASVKCEQGCVLLPHPHESNVDWLLDFEEELYAAPLGQYMDQVDAFSQLILWTENQLKSGMEARGEMAA